LYEFLRALKVLKDYLPNMVIIGGSVPLVYSRYLFDPKATGVPVYTQDLDLLVENDLASSGEPVVSLMKTAGFGGRTLESRHTQYFKFESNSKAGFEIEFLTPPPGPEHGETIVVQGGLRAQIMVGLELLLTNTIDVPIRDRVEDLNVDFVVRVPTPEAFVLNKMQSYLHPVGDVDRSKDIYYVFFVARSLPVVKKTLVDNMRLCVGQAAVQSLAGELKRLFEDEHSPGTLDVARQLAGVDRPDRNILLLAQAEIVELVDLMCSRA
jgi:hypothetical protein